jgi:hypothetical protein
MPSLRLWFVQLSGWPAFLGAVAALMAFMVGLSVLLPRLAGRSFRQVVSIAFAALAVGALGLLGLVSLFSRP